MYASHMLRLMFEPGIAIYVYISVCIYVYMYMYIDYMYIHMDSVCLDICKICIFCVLS